MLALLTSLLLASEPGALPAPLTLEAAQQAALERTPTLAPTARRVAALRLQAEADGALPAPEFMAEAWQLPLSEPWSIYDAQMLSLTLKQSFPGWGVRTARAEAKARLAEVEDVRRSALELELLRDVGHAFADLVESKARHATHDRHASVSGRLVEVAQARLASGGKLEDVLLAQRDRARLQAEVAAEAAAVTRARARLNALLSRAPNEVLPELSETVETLRADATIAALVEVAWAHHPEVRDVDARRAADQAMLTATRAEATAPGFSVALGYYAPTRLMPAHGFGLSLGLELPWLWGGRQAAVRAQQQNVDAAEAEGRATRFRLEVDVATAVANVRAATARFQSLKQDALPATERAFEGTLASYRSGAADVLKLLEAEQALVELEVDLTMARAAIAHALVDLDLAIASRAPREALP